MHFFQQKKLFVLDKIGCVFCTLRVCYEDNLRNALKSSQCEAEEGNKFRWTTFDITLLVTGDKNLVGNKRITKTNIYLFTYVK